MKIPKRIIAAGPILLWLCMAANANAQLTVNYDFTNGNIVADNGQLSDIKTLGGLSGLSTISDVDTRLNLTTGDVNNPMFLGDLYSSLTFGNSSETQRIAVLLNRPGRDNSNGFGSSLSSLNVTLDDSAATNVFNTTSSTGTYQADGRLSVNPNSTGVTFAAGSNGLGALNGSPLASNRVSLLVADYATGGVATLSGWSISTTGTAASSGTFTPGANSWLSDKSSGDTNTIGATLSTTGASGGSMELRFAGSTTFSNGITGSAGITKTGTGTVTLESTSNFTGATSINSGTLLVNGSLSSTTGVTVANSATLGGSGSINASVTIQSGGTLTAGDANIQSLATGVLTLNAGSTFAYKMDKDAAPSLAGDLTAVTGGLNFDLTNAAILTLADHGGGTWNSGDKLTLLSYSGSWNGGLFTYSGGTLADDSTITFSGIDWVFNYNDTTAGTNYTGDLTGSSFITLTAVPEPGAALLGGMGLLLLFRRRRARI